MRFSTPPKPAGYRIQDRFDQAPIEPASVAGTVVRTLARWGKTRVRGAGHFGVKERVR